MKTITKTNEEPGSEFELETVIDEWHEENLVFGYTTSIFGKRMTISGKDNFLELYKREIPKGYFNEFIRANAKVVLFFDLDSKEFQLDSLVDDIKRFVKGYFSGFDIQFIVSDATGKEKFSKHMIVRLFKEGKEYVFMNVSEVLSFVREHLNLPGVDLNVYKPGGCLLRAFGASKEKVGGKLVFDAKHTGPRKELDLIEHFVQWPGELGECIRTFISKQSFSCFKEESLVCNNQAITKVEGRTSDSKNSLFLKLLEWFHFKSKKIYRPRESEVKDGMLVIYVDVEPLDVCPYNVMHKSNKTYLRITVVNAVLKCHDCRLKSKNHLFEVKLEDVLNKEEIYILFRGNILQKQLLNNTHHLFLSKDPKAGLPIYNGSENSVRSKVGSPEQVKEFLGIESINMDTYHNLTASSYSVVSQDKSIELSFPKEKHITACQKELKRFSKNFVELNIYQSFTPNTTINNYVLDKNMNSVACLDEMYDKPNYIEIVYDEGYFLKSKLELDLDCEDSFLRIFMDSPTPVLFARFLTVVLGGRAIVVGDNLYVANINNIYKEYNKEATLGILAYLSEQFLKGLDGSRKLLKAQHANKDCKDRLFSKYRTMRLRLQSPRFLKSTMSVLFPFIRNEEKGLKFNTKFKLLPLKKGVFDSELRRIREIQLDDYISITLPFTEQDLLFSDHKKVAYSFLDNIFKNECEIEYVLNELRIILFDDSNDKVYFLIGEGTSGKKTFINMLRIALKNLVGDLPVKALSNSKTSGMNRFFVNLRNCRIGVVAEYDSQILRVDIIKRLAKYERIAVGSLYANPVTFPFKTRLLFVAKNLPKFSAVVDYALERRMKYIYFAKNLSIKENIKNHLELSNESVRHAIGLGLLQLILKEPINKELQIPTTFLRYASYAFGESRPFTKFLENVIQEATEGYITFFEVYCMYNGLDTAHTPKDVSRKDEYSAKFTEFKSYVKAKFNLDESHTRSADRKSIRVFKNLKIVSDNLNEFN
ncbi:hypothetical protein CWI39_0613p0010 [Hamiltosporidium magnivora]|uniref:SF3 helicase domain-containing protein n=1 Tax=Hamiltosporidium magnivora TaxID=148818 RepID=A0A4Q9LDA7_9MICR|nr:hypothetical protein CWI39_0613p0010 [Hamiltosporidium magnivora]